jgi:acetyltransferase AlgX (SGNH hydrolase-like protein)
MRDVHKPAVIAFLLALLIPAAVQLFTDRAEVSVGEKRRLEPVPARPKGWSEWGAYPGKADRFLRDHFGLREPLATGWSLLKYALRYTPRVAVGRDGWLYYPQHWRSRYGVRTCGPQSAELLAFADRLDRFAGYAAARRVPVVFAVAPDKETLYPEHMPEGAGAGGCDLFAELMAALAGKQGVKTLDLRVPLGEGKAREQVYFRTDSHWNDLGGWRVARALLEGSCAPGSACAKLPEPSPSTKTYSGDLAGLIGLGSVLTERYLALDVPAEKRAGRALHVVGDSFAKSLLRFLAADESVAEVVWWEYGTGGIDLRPLIAAGPDAILIVIVERALYDRELLRSLAAGF